MEFRAAGAGICIRDLCRGSGRVLHVHVSYLLDGDNNAGLSGLVEPGTL